MRAFHNDPQLKANTVQAMRDDIAAERLQAGHYWNDRIVKGGSGCFMGCVIRGNAHSKFETQIGIPRLLARLGDGIFEGLGDNALRQKFAIDFLDEIPVGADLDMVCPKFMYWLLVDIEVGVIKFANTDKTRQSICDVADLYRRKIIGEDINMDE